MVNVQDIADAVIAGNAKKAEESARAAMEEGTPVVDILNQGLIAAMDVVGEKFRLNELYVPEMLIAARAMKAAMRVIEPQLVQTGVEKIGTFVVGTVKGDLHDIGKNLVALMMEGAGFKVVDLGVDVSPEKFITAVKEHKAQIMGMSALLTTTMVNMKETMSAIAADGIRPQVKVIVGGAPLTQRYADEIGADGYSPDAGSVVALAKRLLA